jgi:hypothetical protein
VESLVIGNVRRLTDERNKKGSELEGDEISLKTKVGHVDLVSVGEREKIIFDALGDDEGLTSFN